MTTDKLKCIITGCDLYFPDADKRAHGDLFSLGDVYIFNAVLKDGDALLLNADGLAAKYLEYNLYQRDYFERRGIFIIRKADAKLSPAAERHVATWSAAS